MAIKKRQIVYLFGEGEESNKSAFVLGGKGAGLNWLTRRGYLVPPGFIITTTVGRAYKEEGRLPNRFDWQLRRGITSLEKSTGKKLGDLKNPLMLSVRSGAENSMPGMMDSILNIGLTKEIVEYQKSIGMGNFYLNCYLRLITSYGIVVCGLGKKCFEEAAKSYLKSVDKKNASELSDDELEELVKIQESHFSSHMDEFVKDLNLQINNAILAVYHSWYSRKAIEYRQNKKLAEWKNTAVILQSMVFGNLNNQSYTGVAFSHDLITGVKGFNGEFLQKAQGEDLVSGDYTPLSIEKFAELNFDAYKELQEIVMEISNTRNEPVDLEWTVESGKLFILQVREAQRTSTATAALAVRKVWRNQLTKHEAVKLLSLDEIKNLQLDEFDEKDSLIPITKGIDASPGAVSGVAVFNEKELDQEKAKGEKVVLIRHTTTTDDFGLMLKANAFLTAKGGYTCHAALTARSLNIPAVVGVEQMELLANSQAAFNGNLVKCGDHISINGSDGNVYLGQRRLKQRDCSKEINIFLKWASMYVESHRRPRVGFEYYQEPGINLNAAINNFYMLSGMLEKSSGTLKLNIRRFFNDYSTELAERIALYLMVAVGGELRHVDKKILNERSLQYEAGRLVEYGVAFFMRPRKEAHDAVWEELRKLTLEQHIDFCRLASKVMFADIWTRNVGGKKWGDIAETVLLFLTGKINHELFIDRAFDLKHNGGMAFDKNNMFFAEEETLINQLDIKLASKSIGNLYRDLMLCFSGLHSEVEGYFREGVKQGFWEENR